MTHRRFRIAALMCISFSTIFALQAMAQSGPSTFQAKSIRSENVALASESEASSPGATETVASVPAPSESGKATKAAGNDYRIGQEDQLTITVWKEPELSGPVVVRPDGNITLPLVNDVHASGLTTEELKNLLTEKLRPYVNVPQVTVAIREINSRKVYIIGQVGHEGSYRLNSNTTILQIIAEAGGLRDFANRKKIYLLRNVNGRENRLAFNYDNVIRGKDQQQNVLVQPGDTIVVP